VRNDLNRHVDETFAENETDMGGCLGKECLEGVVESRVRGGLL